MSHAAEGETQKAQQQQIVKTTIPVLANYEQNTSNYTIQVHINGISASCLVDTGAAVSLISKELWSKVKKANGQNNLDETSHNLVGVQGAPLKLYGATTG